jgi:hypothetical protein
MRFALVLVALLGIGCATAPEKPIASGHRARDLYPLAIGNSWQYKVTPGPTDQRLKVEILDKDDKGFFIDNNGTRLAPRTDGVFDGDRFLVQDPVEEGHTWMAVPKSAPNVVEKYKIASTTAQAVVPAGSFESCVQVEAEQTVEDAKLKGTLKMTWTYAPGVGLVKVVQRFRPEGGGEERVTMTMELVTYTVQPAG